MKQVDLLIEVQNLLTSYLKECDIDDVNDLVSSVINYDIGFDSEVEELDELVKRLKEKEIVDVISFFLLGEEQEDEATIEKHNSN